MRARFDDLPDDRPDDLPDDLAAALRLGGEMGARVAAFDWASHPLGPVATWSEALRAVVAVTMTSRFPILLWLGEELALVYNDGYMPILGEKHPGALGQPGLSEAAWGDPEVRAVIEPMLRGVVGTGTATWSQDQMLLLVRSGYLEETYFTYTYSPIWDRGSVIGVFAAVSETTERVLSERRMRILSRLADELGDLRHAGAAARAALSVAAGAGADLPLVSLYLRDADLRPAIFGHTSSGGTDPGGRVAAEAAWGAHRWPLDQAGATRGLLEVEVGPDLASGLGDPAPRAAVVMALTDPASPAEEGTGAGPGGAMGWLVVATNRRRPLDAAYRSWLELFAGQVAAALANAQAYDSERRRAAALAELDRAKTELFSNVSHEFRTPLTLLLAPIADALADDASPLPAVQVERLEIAQRNGTRLLRLVNTLLDFSRAEAGAAAPALVPVDLGALTAEVASAFHSLVTAAGLSLEVEGARLSRAVRVDPTMWEKVVLNLVSNAFKFTMSGGISIEVGEDGDTATVAVRDTGCGIPADEMAHIFDRFHRSRSSAGRSYEGSGIGLALVHQLVEAMGGRVTAESRPGVGTAFVVTMPLGNEEVPSAGAGRDGPGAGARPFLAEAARWLVDPAQAAEPLAGAACGKSPASRVLVVDDNADMRAYLARLLGGYFVVEVAGDGQEALERAQARRPDLVLTDVMMPRLDGLGLLGALRDDPELRLVPVIMLSARAGEESSVEGLDAGADDYLAKPFSAVELVSRVRSNLVFATARAQRADATRASTGRLQALAGIAARLNEARTLTEVATVVRLAFPAALSARRAALGLAGDGDEVLLQPGGDLDQPGVEAWHQRWSGLGNPFSDAVRTRSSVLVATAADWAARYPHFAADVEADGVVSCAFVPLVGTGGEAVGAIGIAWPDERAIDPEAVSALDTIAQMTVQAIDRARLFEREHSVARTLQESILPNRVPDLDRFSVAWRYLPATKFLSVGGDWYDVVTLPGERIGLVMGDVVGHGTEAAAAMAQLRNAMRAYLCRCPSPAEALTCLNEMVFVTGDEYFATVCAVVADPRRARIEWATAG
ncbi:MAG: ATP-binding protein, partial [Acidimicrobiales bacterium]